MEIDRTLIFKELENLMIDYDNYFEIFEKKNSFISFN